MMIDVAYAGPAHNTNINATAINPGTNLTGAETWSCAMESTFHPTFPI